MSDKHIGVSGWVAIAALAISLLTAGGTLLSKMFVAKGELPNAALYDWRLRTLEVQVTNIDARQQRTDVNVVRLLDRFSIQPAPEPSIQPLPPQPQRP